MLTVSLDIMQAKIQGQDAVLAGARAQGILKPILLRRTKDSKLEGKPLLTLPPKSVELEMLQFSDDEREVHPLYFGPQNSRLI
jgi:SNF2 family DNA or RNA helicase